jgi:uncharacterized Zn finger protein (UPF0148 family)
MRKIKPGQKQCPSCKTLVSGTRTKVCPACGHEFNGKPKEVPAPEAAPAIVGPAVVEKPMKATADTITLEQVKRVAQAVKAMGGFQRMTEVLEVIKEAGGVKKFKELAEAMTVTATDAAKV